MSSVCIIPARGGSKRIPDKNIRDFCGKPIIAYSIETARRSGLFRRIVVSTDSEKIADVARAWGAETPFLRDPDLAGDKAGLHGVVAEAIARLQADGDDFDHLCCLLPTAPMVRAEDLRQGRELIAEVGAQMSLSVTTFPYCIFRALRRDDRDRAVMVWPENLTRHSQEFPETFHDAGQFYWFDVARFTNDPSVFFSDAAPVFLPRERVQDIDTYEDWEEAERLHRRLCGDGGDLGDRCLRRAVADDCRLYWEWANDPAVRGMSVKTEVIPWESHQAWFDGKLRSGKSFLFVLEEGTGNPVGQIRFDGTGSSVFEIDISIAPQMRGRGRGRTLLSLGIGEIRELAPGCELVAWVKPENAASLALFEAHGFARAPGPTEGRENLVKLVKRDD